MTAPIRDLYRRESFKQSGKKRYYEAREAGFTRDGAARVARIALDYAATLDRELAYEPPVAVPSSATDDALVAALVAAGGYPRLSERLLRTGHVVCLPLVPFEGRP